VRYFPALLLLAGCALEPNGANPIAPPDGARAIWDSTQACSGRHGDFDQLRFYIVPDDELPGDAAKTFGQDIYLREKYRDHPMVLKHEMLHTLGFGDDHPARPFIDPCRATWESYDG
jgi:hypothetical protein